VTTKSLLPSSSFPCSSWNFLNQRSADRAVRQLFAVQLPRNRGSCVMRARISDVRPATTKTGTAGMRTVWRAGKYSTHAVCAFCHGTASSESCPSRPHLFSDSRRSRRDPVFWTLGSSIERGIVVWREAGPGLYMSVPTRKPRGTPATLQCGILSITWKTTVFPPQPGTSSNQR
jgi:hypothetical protein